MKDELSIEPIEKDDLVDLDPIGIEAKIKELEHEKYLIMTQVYPISHEIDQLKRDLSIAKAKYWRSKS